MKPIIACIASLLVTSTAIAQDLEHTIDSILASMSLDAKIGQLNQRGASSSSTGDFESLKQDVRAGKIGSFLNVMDIELHNELQRIATEESPNKIPLIFGRDVIHGFKTIFPIPLGQAASWDPEIARIGAEVAAYEATSQGVDWTFAPMMDISRDPRWGRIAESCGEDHILTSKMVAAMVEGFQGKDLSGDHSIAACAKHYAAYGAAEGGRDYNSVYLPDYLLRDVYLPPFKAAVDAGVATFMSSFNDVNGVPSSGNEYLLNDILRGEWGFDGFVVSDWQSITEMINHGFVADKKHAAELALNAQLDMEMMSDSYALHAKELIKQGKVKIQSVDNAVKNILRIKLRLGLFDNPYVKTNENALLKAENLAKAQRAAEESMVLLKNNGTLPMVINDKVGVIGPLADAGHEQMGTWAFDGEGKDCITPKMALTDQGARFSAGLSYSRDTSTAGWNSAIDLAKSCDVVVFVGGEESILSGEAHSRADIRLPGRQQALIKAIKATGTKVVLVIMAGRPITVSEILEDVDALIMAWHPGTMGGPALANILSGKTNPSGRLPVTYPKVVGQVPIYHNHTNTGRPASAEQFTHIDDIPVQAWQSSLGNTSHYLDAGYTPLYPFGYGLSYSEVAYSGLKMSSEKISLKKPLTVSATITNKGKYTVDEVVQLYIQDLVGSRTRPVKELKQFQKIEMAPGQSVTVEFTLTLDELKFTSLNNKWEAEPGAFKLWIGPNAAEGMDGRFTY